jgi:hypothetical protein
MIRARSNRAAAMDQATTTLLATAAGAVLGFAATYGNQRLQRREAQRAARMCVANDLRYWLNAVSSNLADTLTAVESDFIGGKVYWSLPDFRFEGSFESVACLDGKMSQRIFELVHKKQAANDSVGAALQYTDEDHAIDEVRVQSATVFMDALSIYRDLSRSVGWSVDEFVDQRAPMMREEIERSKKLGQQRTTDFDEFLSHIEAPVRAA